MPVLADELVITPSRYQQIQEWVASRRLELMMIQQCSDCKLRSREIEISCHVRHGQLEGCPLCTTLKLHMSWSEMQQLLMFGIGDELFVMDVSKGNVSSVFNKAARHAPSFG